MLLEMRLVNKAYAEFYFRYDISDYYTVNLAFGNIEDFEDLLE